MKKVLNSHILKKFIVAYVVLVVAVTLVFTFIFYLSFSSATFTYIQFNVMKTAESIANNVDFTGLETLRNASQTNDENYARILKDLRIANEANPDITFIYTMRPRPNSTWEFIVDADIEDDENGNGIIDPNEASADIGEVYDDSCCPELRKALNGPTVDQKVTHDVWGSWISGYAPIYNNYEQVIGIVGVDFSADGYIEHQVLLRDLLITSLVYTLLLSLISGIIGVYFIYLESIKIHRALIIRNEDLEEEVKLRMRSEEEFMYMIIHELRAPITSFKWYLELLQEGKRTKREREFLATMKETSESVIDLVNQLLDASKINTGKFSLNKKPADFRKLINTTLKEFTPQATAKGITISAKFKNDLPKMVFDNERIAQVLRNLISNAVKYTKKGKVEITIEYKQGRHRIHVEVIDTGIGIAKADQDKLFQSFMRLGESKETGTGLGLVIAKGIVEGHNGRVGVRSKKGQGSTFWFEIAEK